MLRPSSSTTLHRTTGYERVEPLPAVRTGGAQDWVVLTKQMTPGLSLRQMLCQVNAGTRRRVPGTEIHIHYR